MIKAIYNILFCLMAILINGQVSIGGKQSVDGSSTILDFNNTASNTLGIVLPAVDNTTKALSSIVSENNGTFLFDKSDDLIKMYSNNTWINLSDSGNSNTIIANTSNESNSSQGVVIGSATSNAKGILVLESSNKAIILPKIENPHLTVNSPYPGMLCYDTSSHTIAIFDGNVWNYWK